MPGIKKEVKKKVAILPMVRINTRIKPEQHKYIKALAKKTNATEGDVFRAIINVYMSNHKI